MPILTAQERVGSILAGKYRLQEVLAHGGMGVLFRAEHTWTGRQVAVKMLRARELTPDEAITGKRLDRFVLEARAATQVAHPNVVDVLDMGASEDGTPFLAMELLHGESLAARLERGSMPVEEVLRTLLPILGALALAHDRTIVHRDLKPANVFLASDALGRVTPKLLDFGIAKVASHTTLTDPGAALGTPEAMSPEQATGQAALGPATDVWAMGVVLYRCLAGAPPFRADTSARVLLQIVHERHTALVKLAPHVPLALCAAIERALEKRPEQRYASMRAFAEALTMAAHGSGLSLPSSPDPLGLPDYPQWLARARDGATGEVQPIAITSAAAPPEPRRTARNNKLVLSAALALTLAAATWLLRTRSIAEPDNLTALAPPPAPSAPAPSALASSEPAPAPDPAPAHIPDAGPTERLAPEPPRPTRRKPRVARSSEARPAADAPSVPALKPTW